MNRPIKFRVWNVRRFLKEDEMAILPNSKILFLVKDGESDAEYREMDFLDVQITFFTGLQDKNGKEIYEGDFLKDDEGLAKVVFEMGQFMAFYQALSGKWNPYGTLSKYMEDHDGEVIGNIYESPHLLERPI
jgi:uncharacterized phage protein (TIGR01671 family)